MTRFSYPILGLTIAVLAVGIASAEPMPLPKPTQGHGGNQKGVGVTRNTDDITLTEITRVELSFDKQMSDLNSARAAMNRAPWTAQRNQADLQQKAQAIATAELALALKRAEAFQTLKAKLKVTAPDKVQALATAMAGGGAAGGRGGGAAAPAAAPAAGGAAAPRGM